MHVGIISDVHYPYHDPRAEGLFLSILPDLNLDGLMILGDAVDFEPIGKRPTHRPTPSPLAPRPRSWEPCSAMPKDRRP